MRTISLFDIEDVARTVLANPGAGPGVPTVTDDDRAICVFVERYGLHELQARYYLPAVNERIAQIRSVPLHPIP